MCKQMDENKNIFERLGMGKLIAAVCLILFFIFNPDVFWYFFVSALLFFPLYILIGKWLDRQ